MDWIGAKDKLVQGIGKYRYAAIILIIGLVLMLVPIGKQTEQSLQPSATEPEELSVTEELAQILSQIDGAGKVRIMLTVAEGKKTLYQYDEEGSHSEQGTFQKDTVIITDSQRGQSGLIQQIIAPKYQGAIVICQGADYASVRLAIVDAVSKITGLSTDKISVLKMK